MFYEDYVRVWVKHTDIQFFLKYTTTQTFLKNIYLSNKD